MEKIKALLKRAGHPLEGEGKGPLERLADALETVLEERDQLMKDLKNTVLRHRSCDFCAHRPYETLDCYKCMTEERWTWRGVPKKEEAQC